MSSFRVTFHRKETLLNSYPEKVLFLFVTKSQCEPPSVSVDSAVQMAEDFTQLYRYAYAVQI